MELLKQFTEYSQSCRCDLAWLHQSSSDGFDGDSDDEPLSMLVNKSTGIFFPS